MCFADLIELEDTLVAIETREEGRAFLNMLMTPSEITTMGHRWSAFQLSAAGASQREIRDRLNVSIATASRSARVARENSEIIRSLLHRSKKAIR
jgi:uncharacterized protein YerC